MADDDAILQQLRRWQDDQDATSARFHASPSAPSLKPYEPDLLDNTRSGLAAIARGVGHPDPNGVGQRGLDLLKMTPPLMAYEGGKYMGEGYQQGDWPRAIAGAIGTGLAVVPGMAALRGASAVKRAGAVDEVLGAADAKLGPWGNPELLPKMLDAAPQAPRHPENLQKARQEIIDYMNQGAPHSVLGPDRTLRTLSPEESEANNLYREKAYQLRNQYDDVAGDKYAFGRDLEADSAKEFQRIQDQIRARVQRSVGADVTRQAEREKLREDFQREFGVDMLNPERNNRIQGILDQLMRYGPPTAVGGYAGDKLGGMWRDSAREDWEHGGRERHLHLPYPPDPNKP